MLASTSPEPLFIGAADPEAAGIELARLREVLRRNPEAALSPRPDDEFKQAIQDAVSFRVQTAFSVSDANEICAQLSLFDRFAGRVFELGSVLVVPEYRGFGLQRRLMAAAILHLVDMAENLTEDPEWAIYAVVRDDNEPSWRSIEKVGFQRAARDDAVWRRVPKAFDTLSAEGKRLYVFRKDAVAAVKDAVEDILLNPTVAGSEDRAVRLSFGERLQKYADPRYFRTPLAGQPDE